MALGSGTRLGPYEIIDQIGAGGMGAVYRARDARLGRDVAVKTLPDGARLEPDRVARFTREAQTLAALNHPHIGAIYGLEEAPALDGTHTAQYLILELVEGGTVAERLARGPITTREVSTSPRRRSARSSPGSIVPVAVSAPSASPRTMRKSLSRPTAGAPP
jgi:eukaryotic-like serine/threonine-protein kinase